MNRRDALQTLSTAVGSLVALPTWARNWTPEILGPVGLFTPDEEALLTSLVGTILPEGDTPGAVSLNVHRFVMRMLQDCYDAPTQQAVRQGLAVMDAQARQAFNRSFDQCDAPQRLDVLNQTANANAAADAGARQAVQLLKRLTVEGYLNSEYVLVTVKKFTLAPGFYHGCVSV